MSVVPVQRATALLEEAEEVHGEPWAAPTPPATPRRRQCRSWLEWMQLLYSERHLHPARRGSGVAPAPAALAPFTPCDVAVSRAFVLETTTTAADGDRVVTRGRFAKATLDLWPKGAFLRGVVEFSESEPVDGAVAYAVTYADGPYGVDDASSPPPGHPRTAPPPPGGARRSAIRIRAPLRAKTAAGATRTVRLRHVPAAAVSVDTPAAAPRLHRPVAIVTLTLVQAACALWWRRYGRAGALALARTRRSGDAPGPRSLFYRLVGRWPACGDARPQVWRLLSYQLVHTSWLHLGANAFVQVLFGIPMELTHGAAPVLAIYLAGVLAGALLCCVADSYAVVVGASGGSYALLGAHVGAIYKDWDRLAHGAIPRTWRLAVFALITASDVAQWALTREADVSYASHLGGSATGLLLGVLVLRRRPARRKNALLRRLRRPAYALAAAAYASSVAFGLSWYAAVWPPRPLSRSWYDGGGARSTRPCCIQVFDCGLDPRDFARLECDFSAGSRAYRVVGPGRAAYATCGALESYRRARNATTPPAGEASDVP